MNLVFLAILGVGLAVRIYNFPAWQGFDYDQEINAWIAKSIIVDHKPILVGPETSVGGMFVGPYFNYIISFFYLIGKMDHSWTIILNAILAFLTIGLIYRLGEKVFSKKAGLISAAIYALSAFFVAYDRAMWNPTIVPLVAIGGFYTIYNYLQKQKIWQLILAAAAVGFMFHVHFSAVFLFPFFIVSLVLFSRKNIQRNFRDYFWVLLTFGVFFFPLVVFDFRHNFINFTHLVAFFTSGRTDTSLILDFLPSLWKVFIAWGSFVKSIFLITSGPVFDALGLVALVTTLSFGLFRGTKTLFYKLLVLLFLIITFGLSAYRGPLPSYYFLIPLPILVVALGDLGERALRVGRLMKVIALISFLTFASSNIKSSLSSQSNFSLSYKQETVKYILADTRGQSFKVDFITDPGLATGFRYLFWQQRSSLITDMTIPTVKVYKIVIPYTLARSEELATTFGDIGVVKM